jgi:hypothetical protein
MFSKCQDVSIRLRCATAELEKLSDLAEQADLDDHRLSSVRL